MIPLMAVIRTNDLITETLCSKTHGAQTRQWQIALSGDVNRRLTLPTLTGDIIPYVVLIQFKNVTGHEIHISVAHFAPDSRKFQIVTSQQEWRLS